MEKAETYKPTGAMAANARRALEVRAEKPPSQRGMTSAGIARARQLGAKTVFLACVPVEQCGDEADVSIRVLTGPEVITGSTRLKAGTATKMVLNRVTTLAMVQLGKVYENLMVDVNAYANQKLVDRAARIISRLTGVERADALSMLDEAKGKVKTAIVMYRKGVNREMAETLLARHEGHVRTVLES